ncbi:MAG: agmatine deiminase family protein [Nanoarchaeota archaeon]
MKEKNTPKSLGYRMPAEWEEQEAVWLSWPHNKTTWPERIEEVEQSYIGFIKALHTGQRINLLANNEESKSNIIAKLKQANIDASKVSFHIIKNEDVWIRDYGPAFVINKNAKNRLAMVKWEFNAWGNKYDDLLPDNNIPYEMNKSLNLRMFEPGIVMEGGSIEVNGSGTLLTTEQCLLNKNRNQKLSKEEIEQCLKDHLNISKILWLKDGIIGDDTDGHIDDIARFVNNSTIVCAYEENKEDENYLILKENYELLKGMADKNEKKFNIVKIPMPGKVKIGGTMLPASYANFYIGNKAVVVPAFGHENDKKAISIIQSLFPLKQVIGVDCKTMMEGLGTLHCVSQQQPKV